MPKFNVIEQTFPDGTHRWKFFTFSMSVGDIIPPSDDDISSCSLVSHPSGWTVSRKELENAKRARQVVYELAKSNSHLWTHFVTLTFNPILVNRSNYSDCLSRVRRFTKQLTRLGCHWLFVPELHRDGKSFHFHGLVGGDFPLVYAGLHGPTGREVPTWNLVDFPGYTSVQLIRDSFRISTYITKYLTKELIHVVPKGNHRYLHSVSLLRPTTTYHFMTPDEFSCLVHLGLVPDHISLEDNLSDMRFVKKVPMYYQVGNYMYIVED